MNNRAMLVVCVLIAIAGSAMLTAAVPAEDKDLPGQVPLQTCVEGETICIGSNSYTCAENNQWLLNETNSEDYCNYEAPTVCTDGETTCYGFNEYTCLNNAWLLTALNNESCGYVCTSGASYCDGVDLNVCMNNAWNVVEESPSCGYVAPTDVQKEVIYVELLDDSQVFSSGWRYSSREVDLSAPMSVTLHSGGVSGGAITTTGGVNGAAFIEMCREKAGGKCRDSEGTNYHAIALPIYSEITFDDIQFVILRAAVPQIEGNETILVEASAIYSTTP